MNAFLLKTLAPLLIGPATGFITHYLMQWIDDGLKITAKLPDQAKQALVLVLAAVVPAIGQATGMTLPADPAQLATQPVVQSIVGAALAFFLKHTNAKP